MARAADENDLAESSDLSFASFSRVLSWRGSKKELSWRGFRSVNLYEEDVFASAPSLKVQKEVVDTSVIGDKSLERYDREKNETQSASHDESPEIQWDLPANLLMPADFNMHAISRPIIKLTPYGEKGTCDAFALAANSLRCEISAVLHLVWTVMPKVKYVDHAFMRDCLFPWIDESIVFMKKFAESLFTVVLPEYAQHCQGLSDVSARKRTLEKGRFLLCLKAVSESRNAFLPPLPVEEQFPQLVFSCTTLKKSLQYIETVGIELWKEPTLDAREIRLAMQTLEQTTWKSLLGVKVAGLELERALMRGMVSRWMNPKEMRAFARCRARGPSRAAFIYARKLKKAQNLLARNHECLQCNIDSILVSIKHSLEAEHALAPPGSAARGAQARTDPSGNGDAESSSKYEEKTKSRMHNTQDYSTSGHNFTLDDVPSAPSLSALFSKRNLSGNIKRFHRDKEQQ